MQTEDEYLHHETNENTIKRKSAAMSKGIE